MPTRPTSIAPTGAVCLIFAVFLAACTGADDQQDATELFELDADAGRLDASRADAGATDVEPDATDDAPQTGRYASLFASPAHNSLLVAHRSDDGLRLFELDPSLQWSEIGVPAEFAEASETPRRVSLTSVIPTVVDVLVSTASRGAWRYVRGADSWRPFEADWFDGSGRITHLRKLRDRVYAFHEVTPGSQTGVELWQRRRLTWEYVRNDMFMIIDYLPRDEVILRATRYGTVEASRDAGESWSTVPDIRGAQPPRIFESADAVAVATTDGVWLTRDDAQSWQKLSIHGGASAALVGDEVLVATSEGRASAVSLVDESIRRLPRLPDPAAGAVDLGGVDQTVVATNGGPDILMLTPDDSEWQRVDVAR